MKPISTGETFEEYRATQKARYEKVLHRWFGVMLDVDPDIADVGTKWVMEAMKRLDNIGGLNSDKATQVQLQNNVYMNAGSGKGTLCVKVWKCKLTTLTQSSKHLLKLEPSGWEKMNSRLEMSWTRYIPHNPTNKQAAFLFLNNTEVLYGGAAGEVKATPC